MRLWIITTAVLAFWGLSAGSALAETRSAPHDLDKATFAKNCTEMGGEFIDGGSTHAGCNLPSGTEVVCSFAGPGDPKGGVCEAETRVASTSLKDLLGVIPNRVGPTVGTSLSESGTENAPAMDQGPVVK